MPKLVRLFHAKGRKIQFGVVKLAECSLSLLQLTLARLSFSQSKAHYAVADLPSNDILLFRTNHFSCEGETESDTQQHLAGSMGALN